MANQNVILKIEVDMTWFKPESELVRLRDENILLKNEIRKLQVNLGDDSAIAQYEQTIADLQDYVAILLEEIDVLKNTVAEEEVELNLVKKINKQIKGIK